MGFQLSLLKEVKELEEVSHDVFRYVKTYLIADASYILLYHSKSGHKLTIRANRGFDDISSLYDGESVQDIVLQRWQGPYTGDAVVEFHATFLCDFRNKDVSTSALDCYENHTLKENFFII